MSGHSKWHSIKHKKAAADAKRGKVFTRIIREITIAARMGGGDAGSNPRLRSAILAAKDVNMPRENIDKAIKRGTGELPGVSYEEVHYEGYGPGGVAIYVDVSTDNKNRTTAEIRHILSRHGGNLGEAGCVAWMFSKKGMILVSAEKADEDRVMEAALEVGAEDFASQGDTYVITTAPSDVERVRSVLESKGIAIESAQVTMVPSSTVKVEGKDAEQVLKLMSALEDQEDVQRVSANFDIADELIEQELRG
jgi:YebC/PmpR family DNA-binding regulatory protein